MADQFDHDVLIIGSGAAGLTLALSLPETTRIAVLSKGPLSEGSTFYVELPKPTNPTSYLPQAFDLTTVYNMSVSLSSLIC